MRINKVKFIFSVLLFALSLFIIVGCELKINADENIYSNDYAYYKVEETLEQREIYDGIEYVHDSVLTSITDESKIVGYECGGAMYSDVPLYANTEYTQSAHVLSIPSTSEVKVVVWSVVKDGAWKLATILDIAKDYEKNNPGYKVIAGINGDFFDINAVDNYPYTTNGVWISNGEVYKVDNASGWKTVGFNNDGSNVPYTEYENIKVSDKPTLYVYDANGNVVTKKTINKVNDMPGVGEISLYFGEYDSNHKCNIVSVESAYVVENADKSVAISKASFYGKGEISLVGNAELGANQFAIKSNDQTLNAYLSKGTTIKVQFDFTGDMADAQEVCGYVTTFMKDGEHYEGDPNYDYMEYRYPRTLVGYREDGTLVMAATDGRQPNEGYYGLNGVESSAQMAFYGCETAFSLDGGGSTTMVVLKDGELTAVNSPSDGSLRHDGNAIFVVAKVPNVEMACESTEDSITVQLNVIEMISEFKDLYIEVNGEKKKFEGKALSFSGLESNTKYPVIMYGEKDGKYVMIPIQNAVKTKKMMFEIVDVTLELIEVDGVEYYEITWDINDIQSTIYNIQLKMGKNKVYANNGKIRIEKLEGSPGTCEGALLITYYLDENASAETYTYDLSAIQYKNPKTFVSSVLAKIEQMMDKIIE